MSTQLQETRVNVESVEDGKDFGSLLAENLDLLRRIDATNTQVNEIASQRDAALEKKREAEQALAKFKEEHKAPGGYRRGRRIMLVTHMLLSISCTVFGLYAWQKMPVGVYALWFTAIGLAWLLVVSLCIHSLADDETTGRTQ